jgi:type VI secretion system protein ImpM
MDITRAGFFGKLPSHGDFVDRGLPRSFIEPWDDWLQRAMRSSRDILGPAWLDCYLIAPIWRFVLSPNVCGPNSWCGLVMPSVDRVNRYFPLTIAAPQDLNAATLPHVTRGGPWFDRCEEIALGALSTRVGADDLATRLSALQPDVTPYTESPTPTPPTGAPIAWRFGTTDDRSTQSLDSAVAEALLRRAVAPYSLWWSQGSDTIQESMLVHQGLPTDRDFAALLDGQWSRWGWAEYAAEPGLSHQGISLEIQRND